jgi:hypothetical protein
MSKISREVFEARPVSYLIGAADVVIVKVFSYLCMDEHFKFASTCSKINLTSNQAQQWCTEMACFGKICGKRDCAGGHCDCPGGHCH